MDEYRQTLPDCITADDNITAKWREAAVAAGCRWAIVPEEGATRVKLEKNTYYITLTQTVYDVATTAHRHSNLLTGTYDLTPLEAFIHTFRGMSLNQAACLEKQTTH
jgi:hypothetical protein